MSRAKKALIVGGGHNGLVTACYLQRAGLNVLVVEKNGWVGGAATSRELTPGFLFQVKSPAERRGPFDVHKLVATTPAEEAARPLAEGGCAFIRS